MTRKKPRRNKRASYLTIGFVLVLISWGAIKVGQSFVRILKLRRILKTEEKMLIETQERKTTLEEEIHRLTTDPSYIEKIAREEYGMKKEDEEVYNIKLDSLSGGADDRNRKR